MKRAACAERLERDKRMFTLFWKSLKERLFGRFRRKNKDREKNPVTLNVKNWPVFRLSEKSLVALSYLFVRPSVHPHRKVQISPGTFS
jgi:hypothetical protein